MLRCYGDCYCYLPHTSVVRARAFSHDAFRVSYAFLIVVDVMSWFLGLHVVSSPRSPTSYIRGQSS